MTSINPDHPAADPPNPRVTPRVWRLSPRVSITLDRPILMGILNITPDSFADGGRLSTPNAIAAAAHAMIKAGADILACRDAQRRVAVAVPASGAHSARQGT